MGVFDDSITTFLGVIKQYIDDDTVSDVLVNGPNEVFIERAGLLQKVPAQFKDEQALQAAVRNIAQYVGRIVDDENPILDARLPDGSRVAAVLPPCSRKGTTLAIRKFQKGIPNFVDLIKVGSITKDAARFLDVCVYLGKNILVSGGTGSGKTTLLNILGTRVPSQQRLVIIEDASELKVHIDHVVYFETKSSDAMGKGEVTTRDLMRAALRLRPDRIILGEVRSEEAMDLITAMNTGHNGSMGTIHANSPFDSLVRLEVLAMIGETRVPVVAVRRQIVSAIHIVVQIQRMSDGTRKITNVSEVLPEIDDRGHYFLKSIYKFIQKGKTPEGKVVGELIPTGHIPGMIVEMEINQIPFPKDKFTPPDWYVETQKKAA